MLDPNYFQKSKKNKNRLRNKKYYNNSSSVSSNLSSKNTDCISNINNNINKRNKSNINKSVINNKKKEKMKININYLNEFIEDLKINKIEKNSYKKNIGAKPLLNKNNSMDNRINNNYSNYNSKINNTYKIDKTKNKIKKIDNENTFINDLKKMYGPKKKKSLSNGKYSKTTEYNRYQLNKVILNKINNELKKNRYKSLNSSSDNINYDIYKFNNIYNNSNSKYEMYKNYNSLKLYKIIIKDSLKNSIFNLENTIKIFNNTQKTNEKECKKIINYNKSIISNIEKTRKKMNDLIFNKIKNNKRINNYDYDNENSDISNKNLEINEQIVLMRNCIDTIKLYNNLLNEKIMEGMKLNDKIKQDINIYKNHKENLEEKSKIFEKSSDNIKKIIEKIREECI